MHVAILTPWYPNSDFPLEGAFIRHQAQCLQRNGLSVGVFFPWVNYRQWRQLSPVVRAERVSQEAGLREVEVQAFFPPKAGSYLLNAWARYGAGLFSNYLQVMGRPDLVHAHTLSGALIARYLKRSLGLPYLVTLHESQILREQLPASRRRAYSKALAQANTVTAVSSALAEKTRDLFSGQSVQVLPNFIDTSMFGSAVTRKRVEPFRFVAIGDLVPVKAFHFAIQAVHLLKEEHPDRVELVLAGEGPLKEDLNKLTRTLDLEDSVQFLGLRPHESIPDLLQGADALVLSSLHETFGLVLVEAMACCLPVVATDCGGPADIVTGDTGILVPPGDVEALAGAMRELMENYGAYDPEAIRKHVVDHFSAEAVVPRIRALYRDVSAL